jgi:single-strand DNA-binding protein
VNIVVIRGTLSTSPALRVLPSGDRLGSFEITVRSPERRGESVPVVWFDVPDGALALDRGAEVVVVGRVRRRFFRAGGATRSRTEVVAQRVIPSAQGIVVAGLLDVAVAAITEPPPEATGWVGSGQVGQDGADIARTRMGTPHR